MSKLALILNKVYTILAKYCGSEKDFLLYYILTSLIQKVKIKNYIFMIVFIFSYCIVSKIKGNESVLLICSLPIH